MNCQFKASSCSDYQCRKAIATACAAPSLPPSMCDQPLDLVLHTATVLLQLQDLPLFPLARSSAAGPSLLLGRDWPRGSVCLAHHHCAGPHLLSRRAPRRQQHSRAAQHHTWSAMATPLSMPPSASDHARLTPASEGLALHYITVATNATHSRLAPVWIRHEPHVQRRRHRCWSSCLASQGSRLLSWCCCLLSSGRSAVREASWLCLGHRHRLLGLLAAHGGQDCLRGAGRVTCAYLAREEGFLGEVVAVLGPSTDSLLGRALLGRPELRCCFPPLCARGRRGRGGPASAQPGGSDSLCCQLDCGRGGL